MLSRLLFFFAALVVVAIEAIVAIVTIEAIATFGKEP